MGSGIVPEYELGRRYRDLLGEINQRVAALADEVILMVAGYPLAVKGAAHGERAALPETILSAIATIAPPRSEAEARRRLDSLTKPQGSLGRLEDLAAQLNALGITELRKAVYVFAADHGIATEGVSAYPAEVTRQMVLNFLAGGAAINVLGQLQGAKVHVVDAGVIGELPFHSGLKSGKVRAGSRNMMVEAAMSPEEFQAALELGLECAREVPAYNLIAVGEMGIGNTSAASVLTAALTGRPVSEVTGRGTGLDDAAYARKVAVLERVIMLHVEHFDDSAEVLRRLGGLEIAAMTGFMIGAASGGAAIVIDGFISTAAAAFALEFAPAIRPRLFSGHRSQEPGHRLLLDRLELDPILDLQMRLGEGTGAVLAMGVIEASLKLYQEMATFESAGVSGAEA